MQRTVDRDGVVEVRDRQGDRIGRVLLVLAALLAVGGAFVKVRERFATGPKASAASAGSASAGSAASARAPIAVVAAPRISTGRGEGRAPTPPDRSMATAPAPLEGIAVFPAPGTKRIKTGIIVPDDFPLPPGYVRHYQTTDKGRMLPAILMFHPDHPPAGPDGKPVTVPEDRIVPPDMAPAGLPVHMLEEPEDAYADREGEGAVAPR